MIRSRYLGPDSTQVCAGGREIPIVARQTIVDTVIEAIVALEFTGGYLSIAVGRRPTGFPNESVTREAIVTLQDRGAAKPQLEEIIDFSGAVVIQPAGDDDGEPDATAAAEQADIAVEAQQQTEG